MSTGVKWIVYDASPDIDAGSEPMWTTHLDGADGGIPDRDNRRRYVDEFHTLAAATQTESPLPATGRTR